MDIGGGFSRAALRMLWQAAAASPKRSSLAMTAFSIASLGPHVLYALLMKRIGLNITGTIGMSSAVQTWFIHYVCPFVHRKTSEGGSVVQVDQECCPVL